MYIHVLNLVGQIERSFGDLKKRFPVLSLGFKFDRDYFTPIFHICLALDNLHHFGSTEYILNDDYPTRSEQIPDDFWIETPDDIPKPNLNQNIGPPHGNIFI